MSDVLEFLKAAIRNPLEVSTVFPTSKSLAETLLAHADLSRSKSVVELGAGTGAITKYLSPRLVYRDAYLGIELDPKMVDFLRAQKAYSGLRFETGLAENVLNWVQPSSVDVVVSSLPWTIFSTEMQASTIEAILQALKPGGVFVTYVCINATLYPNARGFINKLKSGFDDVYRSPVEWRNIPPAFIFKSSKGQNSKLVV